MNKIHKKIQAAQSMSNTMLCVGLDTLMEKLPASISRDIDGMVEFNHEIIEATKEYCCAYKINFAFYERYGSQGYAAIERTRALIPSTHISIADAKRGDMGYTAESYAKSILEYMDFDSVTVNPYMGYDTVEAFLSYENKIVFVLALTSNPGSADFQMQVIDGKPLYRFVMNRALQWKAQAELGFVVGATHPQQLEDIRKDFPHIPLLIPGIGTQGAQPADIQRANHSGIAFVNSSRAIIYASSGNDFAECAREEAKKACMDLQP